MKTENLKTLRAGNKLRRPLKSWSENDFGLKKKSLKSWSENDFGLKITKWCAFLEFSLCLCLSLPMSVSVSACVCLCLPVSVAVFSFSLSVYLPLSLSLFVLSLSISAFLSLCGFSAKFITQRRCVFMSVYNKKSCVCMHFDDTKTFFWD